MIAQGGMARTGWVDTEMSYWRPAGGDGGLAAAWRSEAERDPSVVLFEAGDNGVTLPPQPLNGHKVGGDPYLSMIAFRAEMYRRFFAISLHVFGDGVRGVFAVDLSDLHDDEPDLPMLCFQKRGGSRRILIPDIDAVILDFYDRCEFIDFTPYDQKQAKAVFVGSTTGDVPITRRLVAERRNARLRAAVHFKSSLDVDFFLPAIVQCDGLETEQVIRDLDVGGDRLTWQQQFSYRYLLSMDGNGATCSRVALALRSSSVLLKYASPHELYYFKGLVANRHYVEVKTDAEVEDVVTAGRLDPEKHRRIAQHGHRFARDNLSRLHAMRYTADVLRALLAPSSSRIYSAAIQPRVDLAGRFADGSDVSAGPSGWLKGAAGQPLIGLGYSIDSLIEPVIASRDIALTLTRVAGHRERVEAGTSLQCLGNELVKSVALDLQGDAARRYDAVLSVQFADGHTASGPPGKVLTHDGRPVTGVTVALTVSRNWRQRLWWLVNEWARSIVGALVRTKAENAAAGSAPGPGS